MSAQEERKKKRMKMRKRNKGITLIALIITIIVMLILVGVSIQLVINSGLFNTAKNASKGTQDKAREEASLGSEIIIDGKEYTSIEDYAKQEISSGWNGETTELPELKENAEIGGFDWYIYNAKQMKFLANYVNKTLTAADEKILEDNNLTTENIAITEATTIYLMDDINLEAKFDENGNLLSGKEWIPIGKEKANQLLGTFEGNNHYICGVYINATSKFNGIFGNSSTIKNLTIKNSYIKGGGCTGGIVGALRTGTLENCHNINTTVILIEGDNYTVGGIVGQSQADRIQDCTNRGKVEALGKDPTLLRCKLWWNLWYVCSRKNV